MSAEVKILVEGYTNADTIAETGEEKNCPTISLVKDGDLVMVVDPGVLEDQRILIDALDKEDFSIDDINTVCITHSHLDHYRNIGMFPDAKVVEFFGVWDKNTVKHPLPEQFSPNVQILATPGHTNTDISLFVTTGPESGHSGVVAICGDIFWKENYPEDPADDPFAVDPEKLKQSRELVLKMADWIIPGHAGIYKTTRTHISESGGSYGMMGIKGAKVVATCKKCHKPMERVERCLCRPWLCHKCCECGLDCDLCGCSHKKR